MTVPLHFHSVHYAAVQPGPRLIVLGAVHGNETCGQRGILRVIDALNQQRLTLQRGSVTLVPVTNPLAYNKVQRAGDRNLNRNLAPTTTPQEFEDHIANWLCPQLAAHDVLLDLHSFQAPGVPFAFLGPRNNDGPLEPFAFAEQEQALAVRLGVNRFVEGWLSTYALGVERRVKVFGQQNDRATQLNTDTRYGVGTTEYMRAHGGWALTLECGQHADPHAPDVAYAAICNTLAHLGLSDAPAPDALPASACEMLALYEVIDKMHADDHFVRPFASFDAVRQGEQIGVRHDGAPVLASADGCIVFPNPNAQVGQEWFYLARPSARLG